MIRSFLCIFIPVLLFCSNIKADNYQDSTLREVQNQIIVNSIKDVGIRSAGTLCIMKEGKPPLHSHVIYPCRDVFNRLLSDFLETSLPKNLITTSFVNNVFRSLHLVSRSLQPQSGDEKLEGEFLKLILLLFKISELDSDIMPEFKIYNFLNENRLLLFSMYSENNLSEQKIYFARNLKDKMDKTKLFNSNRSFLYWFLSFRINDLESFYKNIGSVDYSYLQEVAFANFVKYIWLFPKKDNYLALSTNQNIDKSGIETNFISFLKILFIAFFTLFFLYKGLALFKNYYSRIKKSKEDTSFLLSPEERAELRKLRLYFKLRPTEGDDVLQKKYRRYVKKLHPDVVRDSGETFISFQERYNRARTLLTRLEEEREKRLQN